MELGITLGKNDGEIVCAAKITIYVSHGLPRKGKLRITKNDVGGKEMRGTEDFGKKKRLRIEAADFSKQTQ